MKPVVRLPESTYKKLESLAKPFVDKTPVDVIERLIGEYEARHRPSSSNGHLSDNSENVRILNPEAPGNLTHAKVLHARIGDTDINRPNWIKLVNVTHELAMQRGYTVESLARITLSHIREGEYTGDGFKYLPEANISVQGMQADKAWRDILHLAKYLGVAIDVMFEWRNKEGAAHPGEKGRVSWAPA